MSRHGSIRTLSQVPRAEDGGADSNDGGAFLDGDLEIMAHAHGKLAHRHTRQASSFDASGQLVDGTPVNGVVELRQALLREPETFVTTMTEKLLTYALGRGLEHYDMPAVRAILRQAARDDYRFTSLIRAVVESAPFQMRRSHS